MSKVWVVNYAGHDYSDAERFGELAFITKGYVSRGHLDRLLYEVAEGVAKSKPSDWLLPSGLITLNVLAAACWLHKHQHLRLLLWDNKRSQYREMKIREGQLDSLISTLSEDGKEETDQRQSA